MFAQEKDRDSTGEKVQQVFARQALPMTWDFVEANPTGIGVNWTSPFGPLRIDLAKALLKQKGDNTKLFSFNVGTQF